MPSPYNSFYRSGKRSQMPDPRNCTAEETISTLALRPSRRNGTPKASKRKKLSDRYFRRVARSRYNAKGRGTRRIEKYGKPFKWRRWFATKRERLVVTNLSKEIRIRFFRMAWFNLQAKSSWHSRRETSAHRISPEHSNFGTPPLSLHLRRFFFALSLSFLSFLFDLRHPRFLSNGESPRLVNSFRSTMFLAKRARNHHASLFDFG